jgi:hypothetical protein
MFARPVMSLDACHLKSQWKGTLCAASVLTGMDNIYPVAFAVTKSNEDFLGWQRFLCNLKECLLTAMFVHSATWKTKTQILFCF